MLQRRHAFVVLIVLLFGSGVEIFTHAGKGAPPELFEHVPTRFRLQLGTKPHFKLSCPVKSTSNDGTMVRWTKDGEEIGSEWGAGPYRLMNSNRDLKLRNPQVSDSGRYKCMAINGFGHTDMDFLLEVYDPSHDPRNPAESLTLSDLPSSPVWYNREDVDAAIMTPLALGSGTRLELNCAARGNPLPSVLWKKNGKSVQIGELSDPTSAKFVVENVKISDAGIYSCRVENAHGSLDADFRISVDGISPPPEPIIDQPYNNTTVRVGHTAQFQCKVQWRKEEPMIRWLRKIDDPIRIRAHSPNATILHINNMHLLVLEQKNDAIRQEKLDAEKSSYVNQLIITNVQQQDSGRYFCVVTNAAGQFVYRSAYLEVAEPVKFSPLGDAPNIIIAVVIACVFTFVTVAVVWLCCNGTKSNATTVTFSSSSTSSTSENSKSSLKSANGQGCCSNPTASIKRAILQSRPPPPRIPLPVAPMVTSPSPNMKTFHDSLLTNGAHTTTMLPQQRCMGLHSPMPAYYTRKDESLGNGFLSATVDRRYRPRPNSQHNMGLHRTRAEDEMSRLSSHIYASGSPLPPDISPHSASGMCPSHMPHELRHQPSTTTADTDSPSNWVRSLRSVPPPPPCHARPTTPVSDMYLENGRDVDNYVQRCAQPMRNENFQAPPRPVLVANHRIPAWQHI
ncbi:immunoglobulin i-set domain-containing protein [Ditylenchus destructor]|nr:immunoglobulin i-set domain-containing protein [Ditylenchus destructor]